jgi:hypothetical protein
MSTVLSRTQPSGRQGRGDGAGSDGYDPEKTAAETTLEKNSALSSTSSLTSVPELGAPVAEKRFWWQRVQSYDPNAIATQVCIGNDNGVDELC